MPSGRLGGAIHYKLGEERRMGCGDCICFEDPSNHDLDSVRCLPKVVMSLVLQHVDLLKVILILGLVANLLLDKSLVLLHDGHGHDDHGRDHDRGDGRMECDGRHVHEDRDSHCSRHFRLDCVHYRQH